MHIAALNFRNNGSVAPFSEKDVHKIYDAKQDGIVVIINEEQIGHFFNYVSISVFVVFIIHFTWQCPFHSGFSG